MADRSDPIAGAISRLRAGVELVDEGEFTIDAVAARRKLAERQLADPEAWVLLVLEAAELIGSVRIVVRERPMGLRLRLEGHGAAELAPPGQLEQLFGWVFEDVEQLTGDARRYGRARQLFAYAINAATPGDGGRLRLRVRGPAGGAELDLVGAQQPRVKQRSAGNARLDIDLFDRRTRLSRVRSECALIVARAGYGQWPIYLEGRTLPQQPHLGARRSEVVSVEQGGERVGRATLLEARVRPRVVFVANGVELESVALPGFVWGFHAVVSDSFERDLSLGRVLRDARYEAIMTRLTKVHAQLVTQAEGRGAQSEALARWQGHASVALTRPEGPRLLVGERPRWREVLPHTAVSVAFVSLLSGSMAGAWGAVVLGCLVPGVVLGAVYVRELRQRELFGDMFYETRPHR